MLNVVRVINALMVSIRRGAFDIGSGATKLVVADVALLEGESLIQNVWFGEERPVGFSSDLIRSSDQTLSEDVQIHGLEVLRELLAVGNGLEVSKYVAVATEVFRRAVNGEQYLNRVRDLGIHVHLVKQAEEAELGYLTGVALSSRGSGSHVSETMQPCVWDSGGGSFQISSSPGPSIGALNMYMGSIGALGSYKLLIEEIRGKSLMIASDSVNPVSRDEADALMAITCQRLENVPAWLLCKDLVAIGGPNSIFQLLCRTLRHFEGIATTQFTVADVDRAISATLDLEDAALAALCDYEHSDSVYLIVPKLCLLRAVMQKTHATSVRPQLCIGSCAGLLISEKYWTP
jgi:exopolyphosphatase/pppGpp-phosphohydrolase